ncbi:chemotaxis protein [Halobacillus shinanisalinarum]|uniref:Chemotaxis protein n=1 Tax=Halobacillus shinanisalinarum TaxID=2932258 RepID=A0ABY4GUK0_9BACI|nr:chemotaxis protein [Halobacillus shinanisalinarum]UOQ91578.1 chemotaxis protein [Halobacillus shinanisalinarum]
MSQKLAIVILHGAGTPEENFAEEMIGKIHKGFAKKLKVENPGQELVFQPVYWSSIFETEQNRLWERLQKDADLDYVRLRRFAVEFLADAVAYQPTSVADSNYDKVHALLAQSLNKLQEKTGPNAPLCVISHSLGSIVASNYFYDLQFKHENIGTHTRRNTSNTALEQGKTLALFYTMGSPMALWSLRFIDFGFPINVPSQFIKKYYSKLQGEWLNFYDKDDILAYPLKGLNDHYQTSVTKDIQVNAGGLLTSWTPFSHSKYDTDNDVITSIVDGLVRTWKEVNF